MVVKNVMQLSQHISGDAVNSTSLRFMFLVLVFQMSGCSLRTAFQRSVAKAMLLALISVFM